MLLAYTGTDARVYPDYRDGAGATLAVIPGGTYDVLAPGGHPLPPGDGRWAAPSLPRRRARPAITPAAPAGAPEPEARTAP